MCQFRLRRLGGELYAISLCFSARSLCECHFLPWLFGVTKFEKYIFYFKILLWMPFSTHLSEICLYIDYADLSSDQYHAVCYRTVCLWLVYYLMTTCSWAIYASKRRLTRVVSQTVSSQFRRYSVVNENILYHYGRAPPWCVARLYRVGDFLHIFQCVFHTRFSFSYSVASLENNCYVSGVAL